MVFGTPLLHTFLPGARLIGNFSQEHRAAGVVCHLPDTLEYTMDKWPRIYAATRPTTDVRVILGTPSGDPRKSLIYKIYLCIGSNLLIY